ncbi:MAG TPA: hypothetical protein PKN73_02785 [Candidatus Paceibacterota bacterium]|nr:hypothetical protein [Candidatus Paceibacterota bacterium]HOH11472.1 hypothetical protein [Candidatus Paceibacterota bacterium]HPN89711.1 hypothetical protein [Candidatus Paceibacterota bacterium]HPV33517.1 hypothetical protein [Candidatus Paceibacterota bacterium]
MKETEEKKTIEPLTLKSLLALIEASAGTTMFRHLYAEVDGVEQDILEDGNLSCAFYVSGVLAIFGLIDRLHTTVSGTVTALEKAGWQKTDNLKPGCVIVWDKPRDNSHNHQHIGFYLGDETAIANSTEKKVIAKNHYTYGGEEQSSQRQILAIYGHPGLS